VVADRGDIIWTDLDPACGHEQRGVRPALIVSSNSYLAAIRNLILVVPITSVARRWPHHVEISGPHTGLARQSFAMTEQPRTISTERVSRTAGSADEATMSEVDQWLRDFLALD
jgi:mRNA interferase MazF